jgi:hypothetical protein
MFTTLKYVKILEEVGVSRTHAETQIQIIADIIEGDMATKGDIENLKSELKADIQTLKSDFLTFRSEVKNDIVLLEHRMVIKLGTIMTLVIASAAAVIKLL